MLTQSRGEPGQDGSSLRTDSPPTSVLPKSSYRPAFPTHHPKMRTLRTNASSIQPLGAAGRRWHSKSPVPLSVPGFFQETNKAQNCSHRILKPQAQDCRSQNTRIPHCSPWNPRSVGIKIFIHGNLSFRTVCHRLLESQALICLLLRAF